MRVLQIWLPPGTRDDVLRVLEEDGLDYSESVASGSDTHESLVWVPLPTSAVEPLLENLREVGIDEETYTIVLAAETVVSAAFDEIESSSDENEAEETTVTEGRRIAREELETRSRELVLTAPTYILLTLISAVIATAGLLLDSSAIVVGSMVIAPLIGPSLAASVGTVIGDSDLFRRGISLQVLGIIVAILGAACFAFLVRQLHLVPPGIDVMALGEVSERADANVLVLAIALGAGVAGIISLMTGVSTALVGVMIAVALIPPAAAVGVGIAFEVPRLAIGAAVIVVTNVLSINLASLSMLWLEGYRPADFFSRRSARGQLIRQLAVLTLGVALVSAFLIGVTYDSYTAATTEEDIRTAVEDDLIELDAEIGVRELTIDRAGVVPPRETDRVVITLAVRPEADIPPLLERLTARVEEVTGSPVEVVVEFVFVQRST